MPSLAAASQRYCSSLHSNEQGPSGVSSRIRKLLLGSLLFCTLVAVSLRVVERAIFTVGRLTRLSAAEVP
jgi:hypothetical protein